MLVNCEHNILVKLFNPVLLNYFYRMELFSTLFGIVKSAQSLFNGLRGYSDRQLKKLEKKSIARIQPENIIDKIDSADIKDLKRVQKSYRNIKVRWHLNYAFTLPKRGIFRTGYVVLSVFDYNSDQFILIHVDYADFPELGVADPSKNFWVTGVIIKIENSIIYLKPIEVKQDSFLVV